MALETPRLDDRAFADIVDEARRRIALYCPEWTDHNLSDPGITMIELFAWMTDIILYRLNRVPDKHFVKFMELIGMRLAEAEAARAPVTFWLSAPQPDSLVIPGGTEVATLRTETEPSIVFTTDAPAEILVPRLDYVMTSSGSTEARSFNGYDAPRVMNGSQQFLAFPSSPPREDDAFYLGFDQDLSHHILGIQLEVDTAEGAGIDPNNPPYVFETLALNDLQSWARLDVDADSTLGLNVSGLIRLHLPQMRRAIRHEVSAYWVRCRLAPPPNALSYRVSPEIDRMNVASWGITVNTTHATRVEMEVVGRSDGTPGQLFYLDETPIVPRAPGEYLIVRTEDGREERWTEVSDFSTSTEHDRHYTIDSQSGEIRLGAALPQRDGRVQLFGAIPPQGAMLVMRAYRTGGGVIGNVAKHTLNTPKTTIPYVDRVTNREAARGGLNAENLETSKMRVPGYLRSLGRAVTPKDFEYLAHEAAPGDIGRVHCLQPALTTRGEINLLVIPGISDATGYLAPESLNLTPELKDRISSYLDDRRLISTQLNVVQPAYLWVETEIRFRHNPVYDGDAVVRAVEAALYEFLNPLTGGVDKQGWPFGRDLFTADIMAILLPVPGVDYIRSVRLYPVSYQRGTFTRAPEPANEISVVQHGVIASYNHDVRID
ncbi:MAG: putative baseplate assembly protein [bacterium]|nr:putative baseplate assembly protein [bacterium]